MESFNYIGMGNSTNKKDAQTNAARDFVNYLVRIGEMNAAEVPALGVSNLTCCRDPLDGVKDLWFKASFEQALIACFRFW